MKHQVKNSFGHIFLEITYDSLHNWIYNHWTGMLTADNVINGASEVLELMKTTHCPNILNDNSEIIGSWSQVNDWIEQEWMPKAIELGLRKFAHVVSKGVLGETSAKEMQLRAGEKFEMRLFKDISEAKAWLKE